MKKNQPSQTVQPLSQLRAHLRASATLFGKKWYYGTNLQAIGFLVTLFTWNP